MPAAPASDAIEPGFLVVHGNRLESLRDLAVSWMRREPLAPLENEVILVQSNGINQWLKLALAADAPSGAGIAAALDVTLPARFLWQAYRAVLTHSEGEGAVPEASPLDKPRLSWRLMRLLPELLSEPAFEPLAHFLADDDGLRKRFQLAERLADLFDQYQMYRADWLAVWAEGRDEVIDARGQARPLDADQCWQPALWRRLRDDIGAEGLNTSRALIHQRFLDACRRLAPESLQRGSENSRPAGLPRRVIVFGISSLPRQTLEALAAMSRVSQVLLCVHNPCRHYWADIIEHKDLLRAALATPSLGLSLADLVSLAGSGRQDELAWETRIMQFRDYHRLWRRRGVLPMLHQLLHDFGVPGRLLARSETVVDGERHLTDLVQVVTIHKSKGLEYPLVFLPFIAAFRAVKKDDLPLRWHDHDGSDRIKWVLLSRLKAVETVFAMTVHKSQGSEFDHTALVLPDAPNPILTRELVYTGITRARHWLTLVEPGRGQLHDAVKRRVVRVSGLNTTHRNPAQ